MRPNREPAAATPGSRSAEHHQPPEIVVRRPIDASIVPDDGLEPVVVMSRSQPYQVDQAVDALEASTNIAGTTDAGPTTHC